MWLDEAERARYRNMELIATLYNCNGAADGIPWTADDLMGKGNREERKRESAMDAMKSTMFNQKLASKTGTEDLPDWATRKNVWKETVN